MYGLARGDYEYLQSPITPGIADHSFYQSRQYVIQQLCSSDMRRSSDRIHLWVTFQDPANTLPSSVTLTLDYTNHNTMIEADSSDTNTIDGKVYIWSGTLAQQRHVYQVSSTPVSSGDILPHQGPSVADVPLCVRNHYFLLQCLAHPMISKTTSDDGTIKHIGDINGDGYSDMAHSWPEAPLNDTNGEGFVQIYFGPNFQDTYMMLHPDYPALEQFGLYTYGISDINSDGCDDFAIGCLSSNIYVYTGQTSGVPSLSKTITPPVDVYSKHFPISGGDINGDGYSDLVIKEDVERGCPENVMSTDRFRVLFGPDLDSSITTLLGMTGGLLFDAYLSDETTTDLNNDGFMDLVVPGRQQTVYSVPEGCIASNILVEIRAVYGPDFSTVNTFLTSTNTLGHFSVIGDVNSDNYPDFSFSTATYPAPPYGDLRWYTGPTFTYGGTIPTPATLTNVLYSCYSPGDTDTDGIPDFVFLHNVGPLAFMDQASLLRSTIPSNYFVSPTNLSTRWGDYNHNGYRSGPAGDCDNNGLADFFCADPHATEGPLNTILGNPFGTVHIFSPTYPYPITTNDLPARYAGQAAGTYISFPAVSFERTLSPNGYLELIAALPESNDSVPFIIKADSFSIPDVTFGEASGGYPIVWRVTATDKNGSGIIYFDGSNKGNATLQMEVTLAAVQTLPVETIMAQDIIEATFETIEPFDFDTGYIYMSAKGRMPSFMSQWGYYNSEMIIYLAAYVDFMRTLNRTEMVCIPATMDYMSVTANVATLDRSFSICNLGDNNLTIQSISTPSAPYSILNMPITPTNIAPGDVLALNCRFAPPAVGRYESFIEIISNDPETPTQRVTCVGTGIAVGQIDTDGDGMPNSYETTYASPTLPSATGLSTSEQDGHLDYDRDGQSNLEESYTGMDPTDSNAVFKLTEYSMDTTNLTWKSAAGKTYTVSYSTNLNTFHVLQSGIAGTPPTNTPCP